MAQNIANYQQLVERLTPLNQQHLLTYWDELPPDDQARLAEQIEQVDFERLDLLFRQGQTSVDWAALAARAVAPPAFRLGQPGRFSPEEARARAEEALQAGEVGALLVAGGQGTRLGFNFPKGMYPIGPVSGASLFQIHLEKLLAVARRYGRPVPLYVMTSPATHDETQSYLADLHYFGLPEEDLALFCQGALPAIDAVTGKLLLQSRDRLFLSPDGHGGAVAALAQGGLLDDMRRRGLKHLFYFQVDNPLAPVCDLEFIGYHLLAESELSTLVVAKRFAEERVGNVVSIDGQLRIIEYSDLPPQAAERRNAADGSLELWAGNTAIHMFSVEFLRRMAGREDVLPLHVAKKIVPHLDPATSVPVEPTEPNALKFERFIFDLLPEAAGAIVVEADPAESFAPLKNAAGAAIDSPEAVQQQIVALHRGWLEAAGAQIDPDVAVEISPLFALDAHQLAQRVAPGTHITEPTYFSNEGESPEEQ